MSRLTPGRSSSPSLAAELADVDDLAALAVRQAQAGVLHLAGLLAEDGAQQALLRGQLGLALGRDLADQDVARLDLGADVDDAVLVQVLERLLAHVGDVARDLLGAQLGVAGLDLVLLDVDAGEEVLAHEPVADDDGVLVVATLPAHEGDQDVAARGPARRGRWSWMSASGSPVVDAVADVDERPLVDAGALVGAHELLEAVLVAARRPSVSTWMRSAVTEVTTPSRRATTTWPESRAALASMPVPTMGASGSSSGTAWRCMLEPIRARLASSCSRNGMSAVATETTCLGLTSMYSIWSGRASGNWSRWRARDALVDEVALLVQARVGLGDVVRLLVVRVQVLDLVGHAGADGEGGGLLLLQLGDGLAC